MAVTTTQDLHQRADAAATSGDFEDALRNSAEALRLAPLDHRARLKVAVCLAAYGQPDFAVSTLKVIADTLSRRGHFLAAIGACRDAIGLLANSPEIDKTLAEIHARIYRVEARGRSRVPPPAPPVKVEESPDSFLSV